MRKKRKSSGSIQIIKKSNQLIEARYRFDIWETRIFLSVLSCIRREDEDLQPYRIWYKDIIKIFGLRSHQSYDLLRTAAKSLMNHTFKVNNKVDGFDRITEYHIIRTVNYLQEGQGSSDGVENQEYLDITVEPEMKPLLLQLQKNFTAYDLANVAKLGAQPIRLYELLKQYESIGNRKLQVEDMRRMLEYENEYPNFSDFFRYFIKPAIRDINKNTDLDVYKVDKIKKGRRIQAIHFFFGQKDEESVTKPKEDAPQKPPSASKSKATPAPQISKELTSRIAKYQEDVVEKFGVTPSVFIELLAQYETAEIEQAIRVTHRAKFNQQIKSSVPGFFIKALKEGFTDEKEEAIKRKVKQTKQQKIQAAIEEEQVKYISRVNDAIRGLVAAQPDLAERAVLEIKKNPLLQAKLLSKESEIGRKLTMEDFRQDGYLRELVKSKIVEMEPAHFEKLQQSHVVKMKKLKNSAEF